MLQPRTAVRKYQYDIIGKLFSKTSGPIIELGVDWGLTTVWLAKLFPKRPIFAVDPWPLDYHVKLLGCAKQADMEAKYQYVLALTGPFPNVTVVREDLHTYGKRYAGEAPGSIFFDASHEREGVISELRLWMPILSTAGVAVVHDTNQRPVAEACHTTLTGHRFIRGLCIVDRAAGAGLN